MRVTEFTDPACPFAWSAEPAKRRIRALYPDLEWEVRVVGLAEDASVYADKGFTPEVQQRGSRALREQHGMPIDDGLRPRVAGTVPACRLVVAARLQAPEREAAVLRAVRLRGFGGELIDEPSVLAAAQADAGASLDVDAPEVEAALREDMAAARSPLPEAVALSHKLAREGDGWRYTCPSWEVTEGDRTLVAPGFQPLEAYEVVLANLDPGLRRVEEPTVEALLASAPGEPLATREVAVACGLSDDEAREQLAALGAERRPLGQSEVWAAA